MFNIHQKFLEFVNQFGRRILMAYQIPSALRIIKSVWNDEGVEISLLFSRQSGKTEAVAFAVAFLAIFINLFWNVIKKFQQRFDDGFRVGIASPKGEQGEIDLQRIRHVLSDPVLKAFGFVTPAFADSNSKFEVKIRDKMGERTAFLIEAFSASETSNVESRTLDVIIYEEAQDITEKKVQAEIEPMGAARNATRVYAGTVGFRRDQFYKVCKRNTARHPENHFEIAYEIPIRENFRNGAYKKYVQGIIATHGDESEYFRMKFRNEWILEKGHPFSERSFRKIVDFRRAWQGQLFMLPEGIFPVAGLDVARDIDESVLGIGLADFRKVNYDLGILYPDVTLLFAATWQGINYDAQFQEINRLIRSQFPVLFTDGTIAIDATGDRGNMTERFENEGYYTIGMVFSAGVQTGKGLLCQQFIDQVNTEHFFVTGDEATVGTEFFYNYKIPAGKMIIPMRTEFKKLKNQFIGLVREYRGNRLDLHAEKGEHDDFPDMAMLLVHAARNMEYVDFSDLKASGKKAETMDLMEQVRKEKIEKAESVNEW